MIDPIDSLAFSIQANPGVYALLLGSGVSRAAQIPTGWEITLDLIRKLATASGELAEPDPRQWYREKYGDEPDYSKLIDGLAKTQADRQLLLRPYFEANQQEREESAKQPTVAHRAVAQLVAQGFVKVIVTTNFDRLMERALEDAGISPTVVSSPDQVRGMLPLVHTQHCVIKVHGDYLDTRIRNTPSELNEYSEEFDRLLDQIFDEFGLVVCGWSAGWDVALRDAIVRAPSRRFTTYWSVLDEPSDEARQVIAHRRAEVIHIAGADGFFETVRQKVESIEQYSRPHPLSTEAAVTSLKRYLSEPRYRIQLSDLINESVERTIESVSRYAFDMNAPSPDTQTVTLRVRSYESACSTLLALASTGGRWAEEDHFDVWRRVLERLATVPSAGGYNIWVGLQKYPATLLLYALGLGALSSSRLEFLGKMFATSQFTMRTAKDELWCRFFHRTACLAPSMYRKAMQLLEGMEKRRAPFNDWIHGTLSSHMSSLSLDAQQYDLTFDMLEILIALSYAYHERPPEGWYWVPLGAYPISTPEQDTDSGRDGRIP